MYIKQNFTDGQVLTAAHLNAMEDGIVSATPVKGTDYFTAEDQQTLVAALVEALPKYAGEVVS